MKTLNLTRRWQNREGAVDRAVDALARRGKFALKPPLVKVLRYVESIRIGFPWMAELACGHTAFVTANSPTARKRRCAECHRADPRNR